MIRDKVFVIRHVEKVSCESEVKVNGGHSNCNSGIVILAVGLVRLRDKIQ